MTEFNAAGAAALLNTFRSTYRYGDLLPEATVNNITELGVIIANHDNVLTEFAALIAKSGRTMYESPNFSNPLARFKTASLKKGAYIEEIFKDNTKIYAYKPGAEKDMLFRKEDPKLTVAFHSENRADVIPITVDENELRKALIVDGGLERVMTDIRAGMEAANELAEYVYMRSIMGNAYFKAEAYFVEVGADFDTNPKLFNKKAKAYAGKVPFPTSNTYNAMGVKNSSKIEDMNLIIGADVDAEIDVEVLSSAYNINKSEVMGRKLILDTLIEGDDNLLAAFVDDNFFVVADTLNQVTSQNDAWNLTTNYFLHVRQILSRSPFATAIFFVKEMPAHVKHRMVLSEYVAVVGGHFEKKTINVELLTHDTLIKEVAPVFTLSATVTGSDITATVVDTEDSKQVVLSAKEGAQSSAKNTVTITATVTPLKGDPLVYTKVVEAQVSKYFNVKLDI